MAVVVVTDVFCDGCSNWGSHSSGDKPDKRGAVEAVIEAGWSKGKNAAGNITLHCPACLGKEPNFWEPWFDGYRGVGVRFDS